MLRCNILTVLFVALTLFCFSPIKANAADSISIAIVDVEKIFDESKASKSLQAQIKTKKEAFQKEFSEKEKELKATESSLIAEKEKLSAEEFGKKRKAYEEKIIETRKLFQKRRNGLDSGLSKATAELRKNVIEAASAVGDEKGYDIVLTRDSVLIADKALDITPDVLKKLDSILSDVKLTIE